MELSLKCPAMMHRTMSHNQKLQIGFEVSEINSTNADIIDLAGKEVKELSTKELGCN